MPSLKQIVARETALFLAFTAGDLSAWTVPYTLFAVGSAPVSASASLSSSTGTAVSLIAAAALLLPALWTTLFLYAYTLFTQALSPDEDRLNKPHRPVPAGLVSPCGALARCLAVAVAHLALSTYSGVAHDALLAAGATVWAAMTTTMRWGGGHWLGKNTLALGATVVAMLSGASGVARSSCPCTVPTTPGSPYGHGYNVGRGRPGVGDNAVDVVTTRHVLGLGVYAALAVHMQDLRDQDGDAAAGRRTLPLVLGDGPARLVMALVLVPAAWAVATTTLSTLAMDLRVPSWPAAAVFVVVVVAALHGLLCWRLLARRTRAADHDTHMIGTYIFCLLTALSSLERLGVVTSMRPAENAVIHAMSLRGAMTTVLDLLFTKK
ncbi:Carboxylic ester hydrolase [Purpureocillium lavendulum]|uniref:Carboxylic ester hydrolase n=1 Tax=Purpureocillium lavendulum TaxID=1247861 RepID=A0AB34FUU1_9HYPO|nr:Carboxylic ester hydrolase [Purpureocillium lavendulum]